MHNTRLPMQGKAGCFPSNDLKAVRMSGLQFIFVHGLSGWGSYDKAYRRLPYWGTLGGTTRLVLLGHSLGGATVRLFSELMAHGDPEEQRIAEGSTGSLSPLFAGGMAERIHSLVTLASPMNGTTAYDLFADPAFDQDAVRVPR